MSPITQGKNSKIVQGNLGAAAASSGTVVFPAPSTGQYLLDWLNILVRDCTASAAYLEIAIATQTADQGVATVLINEALVSSGIASNLGTYSVFLQGLGIPVVADGSTVSVTVTLRDVTGAAVATTAVNGLIIGVWGLKQFPYGSTIA